MRKTYYSEFYPLATEVGVVGTTIPALTEARVTEIIGDIGLITDDSVLSADEKIRILIPLHDEVEITYDNVSAQATAFGINITQLNAARSAWISYLNSLSPAWDDETQNTNIDREVFRQKINEYLEHLSIIQANNNAEAARRADVDGGLTDGGTPINRSDVITREGISNDTANVGGRPVAQVRNELDEALSKARDAVNAIDTVAPAVPTGLTLSNRTAVVDSVTGEVSNYILASWTSVTDSDLSFYQVEVTKSGDPAPEIRIANTNSSIIPVISSTLYNIRVRAVDKSGNRSAWSATISNWMSSKDQVAPSAPTNVAAIAYFSSITITATAPTAADLASIQIYEGTVNNPASSTLITTMPAKAGTSWNYIRSGAPAGQLRYYWLKAVDTSGNISGYSAGVSASANGITTTDFTPGVVAIETVSSLPTTGNTKGRTVRFNDKLYTWTSDSVSTGIVYWKTGTDAADISGAITSAQIADLAASKISGQLTNAQIADLAASKISGQLTSAQIADLAANKITGQLTSAQIADLAANKITGQLTSAQIADLAANKITGQLANTQIADLAAAKLTGTITGTQISDNAISAPKIATGAVIAGKLAANSVAADNVIANSIGAKHLIVTDWTNLVANGDFSSSDLSMFSIQSGATLTYQTTGGYAGNAYVSLTKPVLTDSKTILQQNTKAIRVAQGEVLYAEWVYKGDAAASNGAYFRLEWLNEDYSPIAATPNYIDISGNEAITTSWRVAGKQVTVPAGAKWVRVRVYNHNTNTTAYTLDIGYLSVRRANSSKLIVDGSITANLIAAQSITGSKLFIGDTSNIFPDPDLIDINIWETGNPALTGTSVAQGSKNAVNFGANAANTIVVRSKPMQVLAGAIYNVSAALSFHLAAATVARGSFGIEWYSAASNGDLTWISSVPVTSDVSTQSPTRFQTNLTAPANARAARLYIERTGGSSDPRLNLMGPVIRRAASGELIVDGAITANKIQAGSITADRIQSNTITGDKIAANTITTSKLYIGDTTNVFPDANQSETSTWSLNTASDAYQHRHNSAYASDFVWRIPAGASTKTMYSPLTIVDPNREYFMSIVAALSGSSGGAARVTFDWYFYEPQSGNLTYLGGGTIANNVTTEQNRYSGIWKAPATANRMRLLYTRDGGGTSDALFIEPIIRRAASGELIVDGAITANKIQAGSITADRIQSNTITGDKIAANTITTSKLYIGDTTNVFPDANQSETSIWSLSTAPDAYQYRHNSAYTSDFVWRIPAGASTKTMYSPITIVEPNRDYFISIVAALNGSSGGAARVAIDWYFYEPQSENFTYVGGGTIATNATATQNRYSGIWKAPATANRMRLLYTREGGGTSDALFIEPIIRRAAGGELIVDGAITANKIKAGTITGDRLVAGTITTSLLAAQAITVDKLAVTSSDNLIANGMFQTDIQGNFPAGWTRNSNGGGSGSVVVIKGGATWPVPAAVRLRRNTASSVELSAVADYYAYEDTGFFEKGGFLAAPGDEFYIESYVFSDAANIARIEVLGKTVTGAFTSDFTLQDLSYSTVNQNTVNINTSGWIKSIWTFRYNGAMTAKVALRFWNLSSTATHEVYFGNILVRRRNTGQLIVDGAITANKIQAGTITADRIKSGEITSTQIAAGTITTSNLRVIPSNIFPDPEFLELGTGLWPTVQGWYPENAGGGNTPQNLGIKRGMILWSGAGTVSGRFHIFSKWLGGLTAEQVIRLRAVGFNQSNQSMTVSLQFRNSVTGAEQYPEGISWSPTAGSQTYSTQNTVPSGCNEFRLVVYNQGNNSLNGVLAIGGIDISLAATADMLVDGTITASKIVAATITGDRIKSNTITGDLLTANTITARNLAIGNFDNIIPDGDYRDPQWWKRGGGSGGTLSRIELPDGNWSQSSGLLFSPNDTGDTYSEFFPVEPGATYKVTFRVWKNDSGANGFFAPYIHMPGYTWCSLKKSGIAGIVAGGSPGTDDNTEAYMAGTDTGDMSFMMVVPGNNQKRIQFRIRQSASSGNVIFQCRIVRVSDATLISDGGITTPKLAVGAVTAAKISVGDLSAISANLGNINAGNINMVSGSRRVRLSAGFGSNNDLLMWAGPTSISQGAETIDNGILGISASDGFFGGKTYSGPFDSGAPNATAIDLGVGTIFAAVPSKLMLDKGFISAQVNYDIFISGAGIGEYSDFNVTIELVVTNQDGSNPVVIHSSFGAYNRNVWIPLSFVVPMATINTTKGNKKIILRAAAFGAEVRTPRARNGRILGLYGA